MKKYDLINGAAAREEAQRLLTPDELVTMNLFELIFSFPEASAWTDHESFIIGQSNEKTPIWMWLSERCGSESAECAADIIASRLEFSPSVHLNAVSHRCRETLEYTERKGFHSHRVMDMNAYVCARVISPECSGEAVFSSEEDRPAMASLLRQLCEDGEHTVISQEDADNFAAASVGRSELLLWKDGCRVCAMAMIAYRSASSARINTVVTDRAVRGRGYAGMLVSHMCEKLIGEGVSPMLYADAANPSSNRAYRRIGFEKVGEITEFGFKKI